MKQVKSCSSLKWKENLEEILDIENKPFVKIKYTHYQNAKYYMYGGMVDNKLRFYFYVNEKPIGPKLDFILITPTDIANENVVIYHQQHENLSFLSTDLLDIIYTKIFKVGSPYKIVNKKETTIYYGFYTHKEFSQNQEIYIFDCYFSFSATDVRIESKGFSDREFDFYDLDDVTPAQES